MANLGTAYVDVQPDLSSFDRILARKLGGSLAKAGEQHGRDYSKGFEKNTSGVLLPIGRALRSVGDSATGAGNRTKQFGADTSAAAAKAQAAVKKVGAEITKLPQLDVATPNLPALDLSRTGRIDLQIAGASASVKQLRTELDELTAKPRSVEVDADIGRLVAKLDQAEAKVAQLQAKRAEVKVDVDRSLPGVLNSISSSATGLLASLGSGGGGGLSGATARVSAGFISFGTAAGPLAAVLALVAATIGVALVGALAALASSLALATAGAFALGAALGGVLGASLGLLIPVGIRLGKVFESLKADNAAADAVARNSAASSVAATAAATAQATAARGLGEANRQMGIASKAAYREMADAAEDARDKVAAVATAQLSLDRAKLSTERARLELAQFREELGATGDAFGTVFEKFTDVSVDTSGLQQAISDANAQSGRGLDKGQELDLADKILAVREARDREKTAIDGVSDATTAASRAQERHNEFVKQGVLASESYRGALRGVEAASLAVAAANDQQATGPGAAAREKALQLAGNLTDAEVKLKTTLQGVGKALRGAFTPATNAVVTGLTVAIARAPRLVNPLRGAFTRLGEAWGDAVDAFSRDLIRPDSIAKLKAFTNAGARLAGPITRGISALLDILTDIGRAALPYLVRGTEKVADKFEDWARATGHTERLSASIGRLIGHLRTWLGVAGSIAQVFLAFIPIAASDGRSLAESIKALADRTAAWLRSAEGQEKVRRFFADVIPLARDLVGLTLRMAGAFVRVGQALAPVVSLLIRVGSAVVSMRKILLASVNPLAAISRVLVNALLSGLGAAPSRVAGAMRGAIEGAVVTLRNFVPTMQARGRALMVSLRDGVASIGASIATAVSEKVTGALKAVRGLATTAVGAGRTIGRGIRDGIAAGLGALESIGTTVINALIGVLNRAVGLLNKAIDGANKINPLKDIPSIPTIDPIKRRLGGIVPGYGMGDTVPAMLTPGEYVTRQYIVNRFGPTVFADINAGRLDPRIGYEQGQRPSIAPVRASGPQFASGGMAGVIADAPPGDFIQHNHIKVAGGGYPDPLDFSVKTQRASEKRYGTPPRQL